MQWNYANFRWKGDIVSLGQPCALYVFATADRGDSIPNLGLRSNVSEESEKCHSFVLDITLRDQRVEHQRTTEENVKPEHQEFIGRIS